MPTRSGRLTPREAAQARDRVVRKAIRLRRPNPLITQRDRELDASIELVAEVLRRQAKARGTTLRMTEHGLVEDR